MGDTFQKLCTVHQSARTYPTPWLHAGMIRQQHIQALPRSTTRTPCSLTYLNDTMNEYQVFYTFKLGLFTLVLAFAGTSSALATGREGTLVGNNNDALAVMNSQPHSARSILQDTPTDVDILNFALNLGKLQCEIDRLFC